MTYDDHYGETLLYQYDDDELLYDYNDDELLYHYDDDELLNHWGGRRLKWIDASTSAGSIGERCMEQKTSTNTQDLSMEMHSYERGRASTYLRVQSAR